MIINSLDIGEVVKKSGLPASTLRYYEEIGLITSIGRLGLRRQYHGKVIQKLSLISLGRIAGLSLDEIALMFNHKGDVDIDRQKLLTKADEIEQTITQLSAMRDGLKHVAKCTADDHLQCPTFNKLLRVATKSIRAQK